MNLGLGYKMNVLRILRRTTATFPRLGAIRQMSGKVENTTVEPEIPGFREPGQIATNFDVATGNERYEYLAELEGKDPWEDLHPIYLTSKPTIANPVVIKGVDPVRYIGCTGKACFV